MMQCFKGRAIASSLLLLAVMLAGCATPTDTTIESTPTGHETVSFPDRNLETAIIDALNKPNGEEITAAELARLTALCASDRGITDISGLEYCTSLTELALSGNQISDISPLSSLTNLTSLSLTRVQVSDISSLSQLINLTKLGLGLNQISDISPLVSLSNLEEVWLEPNPLSSTSINVYIPQLEERGVKVRK